MGRPRKSETDAKQAFLPVSRLYSHSIYLSQLLSSILSLFKLGVIHWPRFWYRLAYRGLGKGFDLDDWVRILVRVLARGERAQRASVQD